MSRRSKIILAALLALAILFCFIGNELLVTRSYEISDEKIPESFDGFRIVQLTDYHTKHTFLGHLCDKVRAESPDIIVVTGDIIDSSRTDIEQALEFADGLTEIAPVYYVTGNHELHLSDKEYSELLGGLRERGVICLCNESVTLEAGGDEITLIGLDGSGTEELSRLSAEANNSFRVVLSHYPENVEQYRTSGAELILTGHAHGGQIRIPFTDIGFFSPGEGFFPEYTRGLYELGDTRMLVSAGVGNSSAPVRIFDPPEIVSLTLKGK